MVDIIVAGGGPAGMTAALYALRNGKSVLIIEKNGFGGQITYSPRVENFPGTLSMSGNEFADRFLDQIMAQGADFELEKVTAVKEDNGIKTVLTEEGGSYECKAVVLALGVKHRMLGLENEAGFVGNGISFCAVCDGDFYKGERVVLAGGGNSALQEAILLSEKCSEVIILQDMPYLTGEKRLQEVLSSRENVRILTEMKITALIEENGEFKGVVAYDKRSGKEERFICAGLFEAVGLIPENDMFADTCDLTENGYFDSGEDCLTKTPGVFAAGDCRRKSLRQVTTACADGAAAAIAACAYIDSAKFTL